MDFFAVAKVFACLILFGAIAYIVDWAACRLTARPCPRCGEKWNTGEIERLDEGYQWECFDCGNVWIHKSDDDDIRRE